MLFPAILLLEFSWLVEPLPALFMSAPTMSLLDQLLSHSCAALPPPLPQLLSSLPLPLLLSLTLPHHLSPPLLPHLLLPSQRRPLLLHPRRSPPLLQRRFPLLLLRRQLPPLPNLLLPTTRCGSAPRSKSPACLMLPKMRLSTSSALTCIMGQS